MDIRKCYEILELRPGYSQEDLKQTYKDLVQVWHPDRFAHNPRLKQKAEDKLKQINAAYEVLDQALVNRAKLQAARASTQQPGQSAVDLDSIYPKTAWASSFSSRDELRLRLGMLAWVMGLFCLPMALVVLAYIISRYLLVLVALGLVVTGYFAVRWWIEQS